MPETAGDAAGRATVRQRFVRVDDALLWTETTGSGPPLVLLHGGPGGHDDLAPLASMIEDVCEVHRYDQRACGRSNGQPPFTVDRWLHDLEVLREQWGHDRWIVGGHSFGAELALAYAVSYPSRTGGLIYISCLPNFGAGERGEEEYRANRLARSPPASRARWLELRSLRESGSDDWSPEEYGAIGMQTDFLDPDLAVAYARDWLRFPINPEVNTRLSADFRDFAAAPGFLEAVRGLEAPALLVHGEADPRPTWAVEWLAQQLPDAQFVRLPGGHVPWIEAPEELRASVRLFLGGLRGADGR